MRFTQQLLPLLRSASPQLSRVVSVLAPGQENVLDFDNLDLQQNFSLRTAAAHAITMTDFTFEEMAKNNPNVSFVHAYPGVVKTGFAKEASFAVRTASQLALIVLSRWSVGIEESGERHLFAATSAAYPPSAGQKCGVEVGDGDVKKGSAGAVGSGAYLIGSDGEVRYVHFRIEFSCVIKGSDSTSFLFSYIRGDLYIFCSKFGLYIMFQRKDLSVPKPCLVSQVYTSNSDADSIIPIRANEKVLKELRNKDAGAKIWEHTMKTFKSIRGS